GLVALGFPDAGERAAGVGSEIVGTVSDAEGNEVALDLVVRSRLERGAEGVVLVYEALAADPSQLDGSRFVLAWEAFDLLAEADAGEARPDAVGPFRAPATGAVVPVTHAAAGEVSVRLPAGAVIYRDGLALEVREPGPGGAGLLAVTLPASLPGSRCRRRRPARAQVDELALELADLRAASGRERGAPRGPGAAAGPSAPPSGDEPATSAAGPPGP